MQALLEQDGRCPGADAVGRAPGCCHCCHCCHGPVEIRALDVDKLERQSRHRVDTRHQQPAAKEACVFPGNDGDCTAHGIRPNACRKLPVTGDPRHCDISRGECGLIERPFCREAEMPESAALEAFGLQLMPLQLGAALGGDR